MCAVWPTSPSPVWLLLCSSAQQIGDCENVRVALWATWQRVHTRLRANARHPAPARHALAALSYVGCSHAYIDREKCEMLVKNTHSMLVGACSMSRGAAAPRKTAAPLHSCKRPGDPTRFSMQMAMRCARCVGRMVAHNQRSASTRDSGLSPALSEGLCPSARPHRGRRCGRPPRRSRTDGTRPRAGCRQSGQS